MDNMTFEEAVKAAGEITPAQIWAIMQEERRQAEADRKKAEADRLRWEE